MLSKRQVNQERQLAHLHFLSASWQSTAVKPATLEEYRARNKGMQILLSNSQTGPGRTVKQEQEDISRNHFKPVFRTL